MQGLRRPQTVRHPGLGAGSEEEVMDHGRRTLARTSSAVPPRGRCGSEDGVRRPRSHRPLGDEN
jgi:hypothetical protein